MWPSLIPRNCVFFAALVGTSVHAASCSELFAESLIPVYQSWNDFNSGVHHHLAWIERKIRPLPIELKAAGLIVGNAHPGQFAEIAGLKNFEDVGRGPFISDLIRFKTSLLVSDNSLTSQELLNFYVRGLEGSKASVGPKLKKIIQSELKTRRLLNLGLVLQKYWDQESLEKWNDGSEVISQALAPRIFKKVLLKTPENTFWITTQHKKRIEYFEVQTLKQPASAQFQGQGPHANRIEVAQKLFGPEPNLKNKKAKPAVSRFLSSENFDYWIHPRQQSKVSFEKLKPQEKKLWAEHAAQELGYWHSKSPQAPRFLAGLKSQNSKALEILERFPSEYFSDLRIDRIRQSSYVR